MSHIAGMMIEFHSEALKRNNVMRTNEWLDVNWLHALIADST